jgi:hypothetical protein
MSSSGRPQIAETEAPSSGLGEPSHMRKTLMMLVVVAGLVSACSGSGASGAPPATGTQAGSTQAETTQGPTQAVPTTGAPKDLVACSLITDAEAAAAVGQPVDAGTVPDAGASSCMWPTTALGKGSVEISITTGSDFNPDKKSIPGLTITKVSGVGDAAYFVDAGPGYEVLNFKKGQNTFTTSIISKAFSQSQIEAGEKALALLIVGRV